MDDIYAGRHHCVGAMFDAAERLAAALLDRCRANGGQLSARDIDVEFAALRRSAALDRIAAAAYEKCSVARLIDHRGVFDTNEYVAFAVFRTFREAINNTFFAQIERSQFRWRVEFAKALSLGAETVMGVKISAAAAAAYRSASINRGAALTPEDMFEEPALETAIEALRRRLIEASTDRGTQSALCDRVNSKLTAAFGIAAPHPLLISEAQLGAFVRELGGRNGTFNGRVIGNAGDAFGIS